MMKQKKNIIYALLFTLCSNSLFDAYVTAAWSSRPDNLDDVFTEQVASAKVKTSRLKPKTKKLTSTRKHVKTTSKKTKSRKRQPKRGIPRGVAPKIGFVASTKKMIGAPEPAINSKKAAASNIPCDSTQVSCQAAVGGLFGLLAVGVAFSLLSLNAKDVVRGYLREGLGDFLATKKVGSKEWREGVQQFKDFKAAVQEDGELGWTIDSPDFRDYLKVDAGLGMRLWKASEQEERLYNDFTKPRISIWLQTGRPEEQEFKDFIRLRDGLGWDKDNAKFLDYLQADPGLIEKVKSASSTGERQEALILGQRNALVWKAVSVANIGDLSREQFDIMKNFLQNEWIDEEHWPEKDFLAYVKADTKGAQLLLQGERIFSDIRIRAALWRYLGKPTNFRYNEQAIKAIAVLGNDPYNWDEQKVEQYVTADAEFLQQMGKGDIDIAVARARVWDASAEVVGKQGSFAMQDWVLDEGGTHIVQSPTDTEYTLVLNQEQIFQVLKDKDPGVDWQSLADLAPAQFVETVFVGAPGHEAILRSALQAEADKYLKDGLEFSQEEVDRFWSLPEQSGRPRPMQRLLQGTFYGQDGEQILSNLARAHKAMMEMAPEDFVDFQLERRSGDSNASFVRDIIDLKYYRKWSDHVIPEAEARFLAQWRDIRPWYNPSAREGNIPEGAVHAFKLLVVGKANDVKSGIGSVLDNYFPDGKDLPDGKYFDDFVHGLGYESGSLTTTQLIELLRSHGRWQLPEELTPLVIEKFGDDVTKITQDNMNKLALNEGVLDDLLDEHAKGILDEIAETETSWIAQDPMFAQYYPDREQFTAEDIFDGLPKDVKDLLIKDPTSLSVRDVARYWMGAQAIQILDVQFVGTSYRLQDGEVVQMSYRLRDPEKIDQLTSSLPAHDGLRQAWENKPLGQGVGMFIYLLGARTGTALPDNGGMGAQDLFTWEAVQYNPTLKDFLSTARGRCPSCGQQVGNVTAENKKRRLKELTDVERLALIKAVHEKDFTYVQRFFYEKPEDAVDAYFLEQLESNKAFDAATAWIEKIGYDSDEVPGDRIAQMQSGLESALGLASDTLGFDRDNLLVTLKKDERRAFAQAVINGEDVPEDILIKAFLPHITDIGYWARFAPDYTPEQQRLTFDDLRKIYEADTGKSSADVTASEWHTWSVERGWVLDRELTDSFLDKYGDTKLSDIKAEDLHALMFNELKPEFVDKYFAESVLDQALFANVCCTEIGQVADSLQYKDESGSTPYARPTTEDIVQALKEQDKLELLMGTSEPFPPNTSYFIQRFLDDPGVWREYKPTELIHLFSLDPSSGKEEKTWRRFLQWSQEKGLDYYNTLVPAEKNLLTGFENLYGDTLVSDAGVGTLFNLMVTDAGKVQFLLYPDVDGAAAALVEKKTKKDGEWSGLVGDQLRKKLSATLTELYRPDIDTGKASNIGSAARSAGQRAEGARMIVELWKNMQTKQITTFNFDVEHLVGNFEEAAGRAGIAVDQGFKAAAQQVQDGLQRSLSEDHQIRIKDAFGEGIDRGFKELMNVSRELAQTMPREGEYMSNQAARAAEAAYLTEHVVPEEERGE